PGDLCRALAPARAPARARQPVRPVSRSHRRCPLCGRVRPAQFRARAGSDAGAMGEPGIHRDRGGPARAPAGYGDAPHRLMRPVLFHIGAIAVPSFWMMAFLGFFVGLLVIRRAMQERGYDVRLAYDLVLWAYVGGWIGARLFVIPSGWNYFVEDPISFLLS